MRSIQLAGIAFGLVALTTPTASLRAQSGTDATIASIKAMHDTAKSYITRAAAQVPEDKYGYQPTKEVRTMGQLFGHIANASAMICNMAAGMPAAQTGDAEKLATKAEIQKALETSFAACDHAFMMITAATANEPVELFKQKHTRIGAMAFNNAHNLEHYGNVVTYMRINGMVPPSSGGK